MFDEIDGVSLIVAVAALWITLADYRRNNFVLVKVLECTYACAQSIGENQGQPFHHFRLLVRNHGIPLYGLSAALKFTDEMGAGTCTFPMRRAGSKEDLWPAPRKLVRVV